MHHIYTTYTLPDTIASLFGCDTVSHHVPWEIAVLALQPRPIQRAHRINRTSLHRSSMHLSHPHILNAFHPNTVFTRQRFPCSVTVCPKCSGYDRNRHSQHLGSWRIRRTPPDGHRGPLHPSDAWQMHPWPETTEFPGILCPESGHESEGWRMLRALSRKGSREIASKSRPGMAAERPPFWRRAALSQIRSPFRQAPARGANLLLSIPSRFLSR